MWAPEHRALTLGLVLTITFVASEALAVAPAVPVLAKELGGLRLYGWVFSAFMLASLVGAVLAGQAADKRGPAPNSATPAEYERAGPRRSARRPHSVRPTRSASMKALNTQP